MQFASATQIIFQLCRLEKRMFEKNLMTKTDGPFFLTVLFIRRKDPFFYVQRMIVSLARFFLRTYCTVCDVSS